MAHDVWQQDLEALQAIYGEENVEALIEPSQARITVANLEPALLNLDRIVAKYDSGLVDSEQFRRVRKTFQCTAFLPPDYPETSPCHLEVFAPWLTRDEQESLGPSAVAASYVPGQEAICACIMHLVETIPIDSLEAEIRQLAAAQTQRRNKPEVKKVDEEGDPRDEDDCLPETVSHTFPSQIAIHHGELIVDRKSVFQGHLARVKSLREVSEVLERLLSCNKIARAAHNIVSYRIRVPKAPHTRVDEANSDTYLVHQDHDSDGEGGAGSNVQWLMDTMGVIDVMVVVTRWWGGTLLGPARFRHINNAARGVLEKHCHVERHKKKK